MNENGISGGAGAALAAHSKDASAHGQTPASGMMGDHGHASGPGGGSGSPGTVQEGAGHRGTSAGEAVGNAREALAGQGARAMDQAADFVRGQPLAAMAITGAVCLALGVLLSRR